MQNQVSLKLLKHLPSNDKQVNSVDCARELNRYYVGTVASSEVPSSKSLKNTQTSQSSVKHSQVLETIHNNTQLNF